MPQTGHSDWVVWAICGQLSLKLCPLAKSQALRLCGKAMLRLPVDDRMPVHARASHSMPAGAPNAVFHASKMGPRSRTLPPPWNEPHSRPQPCIAASLRTCSWRFRHGRPDLSTAQACQHGHLTAFAIASTSVRNGDQCHNFAMLSGIQAEVALGSTIFCSLLCLASPSSLLLSPPEAACRASGPLG